MMNPFRPASPRSRHQPASTGLGDAFIGVVAALFAVGTLIVDVGEPEAVGPESYAVACVAGLSLALRRSHPVVALATAALGRLFLTWDVGSELALLPAVAIALYTVTRHGDRKSGFAIAAVVAAAMATTSAMLGDESFATELSAEAGQALLPIAVGDALRSRADRVRDAIEAEAAARVHAERLRIARDLHDVVAHGLSTIAIQSGVAAHLLDQDTGQARAALETINATGKSTLEELRAMVGVLRSTDADELRPTPADPDDIGRLVANAQRSGVEATWDTSGGFPEDAGAGSVVAAHRIVQEALTNVARHAGAVAAHVQLDHGPDAVDVTISNDPPPPSRRHRVASTGVGIAGMRERALALGGTFESGPTASGGFRVRAVIPYRRQAQ